MLSTPRFVGAAVAARRAAAVCRVSPRTRRIAPALAPAASAARSFTATPRACFKSDAANDDPGNFFEFAFSKRDGSKSAPSSTTTTTTRPAAAAPPSAAPFTPEANKLADNFGFLFE